jgi:hypothetical protein
MSRSMSCLAVGTAAGPRSPVHALAVWQGTCSVVSYVAAGAAGMHNTHHAQFVCIGQ